MMMSEITLMFWKVNRMSDVLVCHICDKDMPEWGETGLFFHPDIEDGDGYVKICEQCCREVDGDWFEMNEGRVTNSSLRKAVYYNG